MKTVSPNTNFTGFSTYCTLHGVQGVSKKNVSSIVVLNFCFFGDAQYVVTHIPDVTLYVLNHI